MKFFEQSRNSAQKQNRFPKVSSLVFAWPASLAKPGQGFCGSESVKTISNVAGSLFQIGVLKPLFIVCVVGLFQSVATCEEPQDSPQSMIIVIGAGGLPQYELSFYQWSERWVDAAKEAGCSVTVIGRHLGDEQVATTDFQRFRDAVKLAESDVDKPLWIVLIGHGTYDRRVAKFNLRGPDISANELADWLTTVQRPTSIINCSSASGPFIPILSAPNRVVVTATKSGSEIQLTRFGDHLSQTISDPASDLDKDLQVSLWEAFLMASRRTTEYFDAEGRVATEHALLDDNGDQQGSRADQFKGLDPIDTSLRRSQLDGHRSHQWCLKYDVADSRTSPEIKAKRIELELAIEQLRERKDKLPQDDYFMELERLMIPLAELNEQIER